MTCQDHYNQKLELCSFDVFCGEEWGSAQNQHLKSKWGSAQNQHLKNTGMKFILLGGDQKIIFSADSFD